MKIVIDGKVCEAERGEYLLTVARREGIRIPTLCHNDALPGLASCRLCIVEVVEKGWHKVVTSCVYPVSAEIEVFTASEKILRMRKTLIMLLAARAPENETIGKLMQEYGLEKPDRFKKENSSDCILCGLCASACEKIGAGAISTVHRGVTKKIATPFDDPAADCIGCAACASICPTGAIKVQDKSGTRQIWNKAFELLICPDCGKPVVTREQAEYLRKQMQGNPIEYSGDGTVRCERCKKAAAADRFRTAFL
ncbi:(2Fe-2S)-binding protein [Heliobacterium chlorum]|uniref:Ferredoxin n=1 Tax=Heliobacterium chlorum TaxID=2698 RepID=A0ABR7T019_HELCL|nr:2Fe-2S iron-sulfur cluster-binding protein [Heliobacterium chlorum]MBC9784139.1 (2Fe-2S)-binding protein [Heliobacterium chlorum]